PPQAIAKLGGAVALAGIAGGLCRGERGPLGADLLGGFGERARLGAGEVVADAGDQQRPQRPQLAAGRESRTPGAGVAVPGAGEAGEAGSAPVAVRGEHRADPAGGAVDVSADDD